MARLLKAIRLAVQESDDSPATIAARAGVHRSVLSKLMAGKTVTVEIAEKLAAALGLVVKIETKRRKGR